MQLFPLPFQNHHKHQTPAQLHSSMYVSIHQSKHREFYPEWNAHVICLTLYNIVSLKTIALKQKIMSVNTTKTSKYIILATETWISRTCFHTNYHLCPHQCL